MWVKTLLWIFLPCFLNMSLKEAINSGTVGGYINQMGAPLQDETPERPPLHNVQKFHDRRMLQKPASWPGYKSARGVLVLKAPPSPGQTCILASLRPLDIPSVPKSLNNNLCVSVTKPCKIHVFVLSCKQFSLPLAIVPDIPAGAYFRCRRNFKF